MPAGSVHSRSPISHLDQGSLQAKLRLRRRAVLWSGGALGVIRERLDEGHYRASPTPLQFPSCSAAGLANSNHHPDPNGVAGESHLEGSNWRHRYSKTTLNGGALQATALSD